MIICTSNENYKGKSIPKCGCPRCWQLYFEVKGDKPVTGTGMAEMIRLNPLYEISDEFESQICTAIANRLFYDPRDD